MKVYTLAGTLRPLTGRFGFGALLATLCLNVAMRRRGDLSMNWGGGSLSMSMFRKPINNIDILKYFGKMGSSHYAMSQCSGVHCY